MQIISMRIWLVVGVVIVLVTLTTTLGDDAAGGDRPENGGGITEQRVTADGRSTNGGAGNNMIKIQGKEEISSNVVTWGDESGSRGSGGSDKERHMVVFSHVGGKNPSNSRTINSTPSKNKAGFSNSVTRLSVFVFLCCQVLLFYLTSSW